MIVTDKLYAIENRLLKFLDRICARISQENPRLDYPLLIDGYEGYGKTNMAAGLAYYVAYKTKRQFNLNQIFFDAEEMVNFAINNSNQVILWDEAALAALAMQHSDKIQVALVKMLMVARKKRHLFIICIPRFYRLKEPIIERCMGLVHVYARKETQVGRFYFYKKSGLDRLYEDYRRTRRKPDYRKYVNVRGSFSQALGKVVNEEEYDLKKDKAILSILANPKGKANPYKAEIYKLKKALSNLKLPIKTKVELSKQLGVSDDTLRTWANLKEETENPVEPLKNLNLETHLIYTKGVEGKNNKIILEPQ